jgi:hypothetical protein
MEDTLVRTAIVSAVVQLALRVPDGPEQEALQCSMHRYH